jgi:heme-degrading monooxygenase HmoA
VFVLHVAIKIKPGQDGAARNVFTGPFKAAISAQPGFQGVQFLKPQEGDAFVLTIAFESQAQQQAWVATDLHTQVWSQMEVNFESYSVKTYNTI